MAFTLLRRTANRGAVYAGLAGLIGFLTSPPLFADSVAHLKKLAEDSRTLEARFTQIVYTRDGRKPRQVNGRFLLSRPDRFRWEIHRPYEQLLVGDGQKVWFYDPDLRQVTVRAMDQALSGSPAALLTGRGPLEQRFSLKDLGDRNNDGVQWVEAQPLKDSDAMKEGKAGKDARRKGKEAASESGFEWIRIAFVNGQLHSMELRDLLGQVTVTEFHNVARNATLDPSQFRFTPPAGVDVVGEGALPGKGRSPPP